MSSKFFYLALCSLLLALSFPAQAQQPKKVARIGFLAATSPSTSPERLEAFRRGLRELGYTEGSNLLIEYRYAEGKLDRLPELAAELVRLKVDLIVTQGTLAAVAASRATKTIPIVAGGSGDLVGAGLVASLAKPGGNVTGFTNIDPDLSAKRLNLLKDALPRLSRLSVLYYGKSGDDNEELKETQGTARTLGIQVQPVQVTEPDQFQNAYAAMTKNGAEALIIFHGSFTLYHRSRLLELANKHRLSTMCGETPWAEAGCLMSYGHDRRDQYHRAAIYVDRVLKGTKPADLPVQQPMKFDLVINLKTVKQIGLTIPQSVLYRADRVIK